MIRRGALLVAAVGLAAGCADGLAFRVDDRLQITSPRDRETVTLPLTLRWEVTGIDDGSFAVFVDRTPIRPGATFVDLPGAYSTTETELVIDQVNEPADGSERHTATIVLLDEDGRRDGESAWDVVFEVEEEG